MTRIRDAFTSIPNFFAMSRIAPPLIRSATLIKDHLLYGHVKGYFRMQPHLLSKNR